MHTFSSTYKHNTTVIFCTAFKCEPIGKKKPAICTYTTEKLGEPHSHKQLAQTLSFSNLDDKNRLLGRAKCRLSIQDNRLWEPCELRCSLQHTSQKHWEEIYGALRALSSVLWRFCPYLWWGSIPLSCLTERQTDTDWQEAARDLWTEWQRPTAFIWRFLIFWWFP